LSRARARESRSSSRVRPEREGKIYGVALAWSLPTSIFDTSRSRRRRILTLRDRATQASRPAIRIPRFRRWRASHGAAVACCSTRDAPLRAKNRERFAADRFERRRGARVARSSDPDRGIPVQGSDLSTSFPFGDDRRIASRAIDRIDVHDFQRFVIALSRIESRGAT